MRKLRSFAVFFAVLGSKFPLVDKHVRDARGLLAGGDATAASALADEALALAPRLDGALEIKARALLALRRYKDVADMLREYVPSRSAAGGDDSSGSSSGSSVGSNDKLLSPGRALSESGDLSFRCFDVADIKRRVGAVTGLTKNSEKESQWRYLVLGQACFHLGLVDDALALLQAGRRAATAVSRRESVSLSEDSFSFFPSAAVTTGGSTTTVPVSRPPSETDSAMHLLAHIKLLLRRRAAAAAALDAGLPAEAVRHYTKILEWRRGVPAPFAVACLVGRAAAHRAAGRSADAIGDCNRALALDPAHVPALRARAALFESVGAVADSLRDLDHLKLLYDAALRDGRLPGPRWRVHGLRYSEVLSQHRSLTARIQELRNLVAASGGAAAASTIDYYKLLNVNRGCTRSELERAHRLLSLKHKPERVASFAEKYELVDNHRDHDAVRDQARTSASLLHRMLQKGYASVMADVNAATAANVAETAPAPTRALPPLPPQQQQQPAAAPPFQGVFCRDMVAVGTMLSRAGAAAPAVNVNRQAMRCR